jgi:hypothetical protein
LTDMTFSTAAMSSAVNRRRVEREAMARILLL